MTLLLTGLSRSSRVLSAVVAVLILCALAGTITGSLSLRRHAGKEAERDTNRLATVLAEQSSRMLEPVDHVLIDIIRDIERSGAHTPAALRVLMGNPSAHLDLASRISGLSQTDGIVVFGADGVEISTSRTWPAPPLSVADRGYFQAMRAKDAPAPYISAPLISRATGQRGVFVVRRISAPDGSFLGVLAALVRLNYLQDFYAAIRLPPGTAVTVLRGDGLVLAYSPPSRAFRTHMMPTASPWYATVAAGGGDYWSPGWLDGEARQVSVRRVPGFPVVIDVSMTQSAIYAVWWGQITTIAVATVCSLVCLLLLWRSLMAQFQKLEAVQTALRKKSVLLETTLANMDQGLIMITADRTVGVFNDRALRLLDLPSGLIREGVRIDDLPSIPCDHCGCAEPGGDLPARPEPVGSADETQAAERHGPNGTILEVRSVALSGGGLVQTFTDITRRKLAERRVIHASRHDMLTGLPNRAMFSQRLEAAISAAASDSSGFAVMFLDLDRFKLVNDTLGHAAGDDLLQQVAGRMRTAVRETDTLARIGGDEFALVMPGMVRPETAIVTAERLRGAVRAPFVLAQGPASVGVSIGIACYPADGGSSAETAEPCRPRLVPGQGHRPRHVLRVQRGAGHRQARRAVAGTSPSSLPCRRNSSCSPISRSATSGQTGLSARRRWSAGTTRCRGSFRRPVSFRLLSGPA